MREWALCAACSYQGTGFLSILHKTRLITLDWLPVHISPLGLWCLCKSILHKQNLGFLPVTVVMVCGLPFSSKMAAATTIILWLKWLIKKYVGCTVTEAPGESSPRQHGSMNLSAWAQGKIKPKAPHIRTCQNYSKRQNHCEAHLRWKNKWSVFPASTWSQTITVVIHICLFILHCFQICEHSQICVLFHSFFYTFINLNRLAKLNTDFHVHIFTDSCTHSQIWVDRLRYSFSPHTICK